jgi:cytochrome c oxidase assembly protein subunit 11
MFAALGRRSWCGGLPRRWSSTSAAQDVRDRNTRLALYAASTVVGVLGGSYAAVPLYKIFCQATGFGGTTQKADMERAKTLTPVKDGRVLRITFNADTSDTMPWKFRPSQREVNIVPGETALAFFKATNKSDKPVTGVATYNVTPMRAGVYFNKIQCFCFEEQRLGPKEEVDMPVFFYVDPEFLDDPIMDDIKTLTLSYTFFKTEHVEEEAELAAM